MRVLAVLLVLVLAPASVVPALSASAAPPAPATTVAASPAVAPAVQRREPDPRWVFYSRDTTRYTSPWWRGARRTMIGYGCTRAPYYSPDARCRRGHGFHHGIDVALPCGTRILAGLGGRVVSNDAYGPAYGGNPVVIRNRRHGVDILVAHARRVQVAEGDRVRRGMLLARSSDWGAPDGCHLHFEVRAIGGGLSTARNPVALLRREAKA